MLNIKDVVDALATNLGEAVQPHPKAAGANNNSNNSNTNTNSNTGNTQPPQEKITFEDRVSRNVMFVLVVTILAGSAMMTIALFSPRADAIGEVLPFATGLIGFIGGLVTAIFGK